MYLLEVNKTLNYLRQCWDTDSGRSMDTVNRTPQRHRSVSVSSRTMPSGPNHIDRSIPFVRIPDRSLSVDHFHSTMMWPVPRMVYSMPVTVHQDLERRSVHRSQTPHQDSVTVHWHRISVIGHWLLLFGHRQRAAVKTKTNGNFN